MDVLNLAYFAVRNYSLGILNFVATPLVWVFIFLMISQYRKIANVQIDMYGHKVRYTLKDLISTAVLSGIIAGFIATIVTTVFGITFYKFNGLQFLILLSLIFMLINPRYICLSYSGGILSIVVLILTSIVEGTGGSVNNSILTFLYNNLSFDVSALMALIALMHLVEASLMWFDGFRGAIPVFMKREGKIVGAFIMQRFWIIPMIFFIYIQGDISLGETIQTPNWWPIIRPPLPEEALKNAIFAALPLFPAMLGYADFAVTMTVREKVKRSSINLFIFSITLLLISILSVKIYVFKYIAALFAPIAHDAMIIFEKNKEKKGKPLWEYSGDGIVVLDTMPQSPAEEMGIKSGDKILSINNKRVYSIEEVEQLLMNYITFIWVEVEDIKGNKKVLEYRNYIDGVRGLGIIFVPKYEHGIPIVEEQQGYLIGKIKKFFNRDS